MCCSITSCVSFCIAEIILPAYYIFTAFKVLYHLFEQYLELDQVLPIDIAAAILSFIVVVGGGLMLGIIYGYAGSFITKYTVHNRIIEPTFVFVTCYLAYLTAEIFHLSGIIA